MTGTLVELAARGAQDAYLIGSPTVTFFRAVYKKHSNFAVECIKLNFSGSPNWGRQVTATVARNGDLVSEVYFHCNINALAESAADKATNDTNAANDDNNRGSARFVNDLGNAMVDFSEVEIGGQAIDKMYGAFQHAWHALSCPSDKKDTGLDEMTAFVADAKEVARTSEEEGALVAKCATAQELFVPLPFWFARNHGLALPLISLQYHEVKINISIRGKSDCIITTPTINATEASREFKYSGGEISDACLYANYIYLDSDERKRFARMNHEYLIEQTQHSGTEMLEAGTSKEARFRQDFNHPTKELIWVTSEEKQVAGPTYVAGTAATHFDVSSARDPFLSDPIVEEAKLSLNGHDRTDWMSGKYWRTVQPFEHHTRTPRSRDGDAGIHVMSFALQPEEHQPSGTLNMSRVDNTMLHLRYTSATSAKMDVYARNYNVLRVMSGMAGLAYSN